MKQSVGTSLYDAAFEHDSCGFGLVAQIDGRASAWVVDTAFEALAKLSHRGAVNADGVSGDGCGVLIRRPQAWLRALAEEAGIVQGRGLVGHQRGAGDAAEVEGAPSESCSGLWF